MNDKKEFDRIKAEELREAYRKGVTDMQEAVRCYSMKHEIPHTINPSIMETTIYLSR